MAWEWSHSQEAYRDAELNLEEQSIDWLREVLIEIIHHQYGDYGLSFELLEEHIQKEFDEWDKEKLVELIWEHASTQNRTCDNGGFNAWMCPTGCHTVPFDRNENTDD